MLLRREGISRPREGEILRQPQAMGPEDRGVEAFSG